jgi:2-methylisocitrate lyase-like PEP mutase family enzyme
MSLARFSGRRSAYRALHRDGCFIQPNPWDRGSAIWLAGKGFPALATSSAALAFTRGKPDGQGMLGLDEVLANIADIVEATGLPVNADFENGYADDIDGLRAAVKACVATGVAGLSIEDNTGRPADPLYPIEVAVERIKAARAAIAETGADIVLTARAEAFLVGHPDPMPDVMARLKAFRDAGADCLFAPGLRTPDSMKAVIDAVAPAPVNIIVSRPTALTIDDITALGARRVSVGSALFIAAWKAFDSTASALAEGRFQALSGDFSYADVNGFYSRAGRP